jgi:hypothetical protein
MTYDQYWRQDGDLVKFYRKADEIRKKRINQEAWLQGAYIYQALCCVAPVLHAFAKNGTKPEPYPEKLIPLTKSDLDMRREEEMEARAAGFRAFVQAKNTEWRKKKREVEGK